MPNTLDFTGCLARFPLCNLKMAPQLPEEQLGEAEWDLRRGIVGRPQQLNIPTFHKTETHLSKLRKASPRLRTLAPRPCRPSW